MTDLSSWTAYFQDFGQFFNGFLFTLALAIGSFILAMVLGIFFGAMSTSKRPILRILARIFVEFYQNTPLLVQFVIVFYGLPLISDHIIMIPIYWTAVLCVGLYHGAYITALISLRLFVQGFSLFLVVRWRPPCRKVLPISVPCA